MSDDPFFIDCVREARSEKKYKVCFQWSRHPILDHEPLSEDEAEFLCAHMNAAYWKGLQNGEARKLAAIQDALGIRR